MKFTFNHFNFNVLNMQRSLEFYEQALGLHIARKHTAADGSFQLIYLEDDLGQFQLELTELKDRINRQIVVRRGASGSTAEICIGG